MNLLKEQAVEVIERMPDEKMVYVMAILQNIEAMSHDNATIGTTDKKVEAFARLEKQRKVLPADIDYKKELEEAREEKYGNIS